MKRFVALAAVVAALAVAPAAVAATTPTVESLDGHAYALLELDRARGKAAEPLLRRSGGELVSRELLLWKLPAAAAKRITPRLVREGRLRRLGPNLVWIRPAFLSHITSGDELLEDQWWLRAVGADRVEPPGPGKPVTVIDSGLDATHPEFAGRPNTILLNPQVADTASPGDVHGTAVASVVGAPANGSGIVGVYPNALLQNWDLSPTNAIDLASLVQGIVQASSRAAGVINLSVGFSRFNAFLEDAILVAFGQGSVVVAASGNEQQAGNPILFPANMNHVLTVAATAPNDQPTVFSSSSPGVDLAAPGEQIPAAIPTRLNPGFPYALVDGTSFAAPIVAGATAWVWTARPQLDNTQLFDLMRYSARDVAPQGFDRATGFGILDIPTALTRPAPPSDHQEPNDDVDHVKPNGLFRQAATPLTRAGRGTASLRARLDATEDPGDVYRVWVPPARRVTATVTVTENATVSAELWRPTARSVLVRGAARRTQLIAASARPGTTREVVAFTNRGRRGVFVYLHVFLAPRGSLDAQYAVRVATTRP